MKVERTRHAGGSDGPVHVKEAGRCHQGPAEIAEWSRLAGKAAGKGGAGHLSIDAVSESSTMKVDCPDMMWSRAPMRTKTASMGERVTDSAGTQAPTWEGRASGRLECLEEAVRRLQAKSSAQEERRAEGQGRKAREGSRPRDGAGHRGGGGQGAEGK